MRSCTARRLRAPPGLEVVSLRRRGTWTGYSHRAPDPLCEHAEQRCCLSHRILWPCQRTGRRIVQRVGILLLLPARLAGELGLRAAPPGLGLQRRWRLFLLAGRQCRGRHGRRGGDLRGDDARVVAEGRSDPDRLHATLPSQPRRAHHRLLDPLILSARRVPIFICLTRANWQRSEAKGFDVPQAAAKQRRPRGVAVVFSLGSVLLHLQPDVPGVCWVWREAAVSKAT